MSFLKEILFNFKLKDLLQQFFLNKYQFNYFATGHSTSYKNSDFLVLKRESNRETSGSRRNRSKSRDSSYNVDSKKSIEKSPTRASTNVETNRRVRSAKPSNYEKNLRKTVELKPSDNLAKDYDSKVRRDKYSLANEVKYAQNNRLKGNSSHSMRDIIARNRENRSAQVNRIKGMDEEQIIDYLDATSSQVEGRGIINSQLKIAGLLIFVLIVILFLIGTFLNKNNPLIPLVHSISRPLTIQFLDNKDIKILEVKRNNRNLTSDSNISKNLENSFIALHALNELIYQKSKQTAEEERIPVENVKIDQDYINFLIYDYKNYINSPRETLVRANRGFTSKVFDSLMIIPNKLLNYVNNLLVEDENEMQIGFELINEFGLKDQPLTPDNKVDTYYMEEIVGNNGVNTNEFYVINNCVIFKSEEDLSNPNCKYSSINIIMNKLYTPDNSGFFSYYLNPIKNYLLIDWLREKVTLDKFLLLFLNMTYFGNYQIGLKASFTQYFEKLSPDTMDVPHSLYMIKHLYDNNKKYYPDYDINIENILDMMIINDHVPQEIKYPILKRIEEISKTRKLPRTSFAIYLDQLFSAGYSYFPDFYDINVKTTFSNGFQNSLASMIISKLKSGNIPTGSAIIIEDNKIISGLTISLIDGKSHYQNMYPETYVYNSIKPFMYLALLENKKDIPSQLLKSNYQNLIFSNKRIEQEEKPFINPNLTLYNEQEKISIKDLEFIDEKNLNTIPNGIRKSLAERLTYLENEFLSSVSLDDYKSVLEKIKISTKNSDLSISNLLNGNVRIDLYDLVRSYTVFTKNSSIMESKIIDTINNNTLKEYEAQKLLSLRKTYTDMLKDIYFNTIITKDGSEYFVMLDFQTAIVFNDRYTIALWLGDLSGNKEFKDTTESLESLIKDVLNLLS